MKQASGCFWWQGWRWVLVLFLALGMCFACTKKETQTQRIVNLAIWSNYVSPEFLAGFEKKTGIKVQVSNYSSNEELLAKLQAGASGYDVAVPSDYMVFAMIKLGLVQELNQSLLPNSKALDSNFIGKSYDPGNKFSYPYDWGTTGIAVNRDMYKGKLKSWKDLFETPELSGRFTLLDDVRETMGAALKAQGLSLNTTKPEDLKKAKELLLRVRSRVKAFTSEPMMSLVNGETAVAHIYMSDALQARRKTGGKVEYIIPEEGATLWIDNLVIPKGAANVKEAHEFINYLLDANSNVATVKSVLVAPVNKGAKRLLPTELQSDPAMFPSLDVMTKLEMLQDLGDAITAWDRVWTEVKAGH
jgi:spermidine/putrescine transport system substrate-binding protein